MGSYCLSLGMAETQLLSDEWTRAVRLGLGKWGNDETNPELSQVICHEQRWDEGAHHGQHHEGAHHEEHHAHGENSHHQVSRLQHGHHEVICPTPEGTFRNPANCSEFYQCVAGIPYLQFCPDPTTYFSPDCNCCDWKENVDCGSHHVVSQRSQKVERPHHERLHVLPRQHHLHQTDRGLDLKNY